MTSPIMRTPKLDAHVLSLISAEEILQIVDNMNTMIRRYYRQPCWAYMAALCLLPLPFVYCQCVVKRDEQLEKAYIKSVTELNAVWNAKNISFQPIPSPSQVTFCCTENDPRNVFYQLHVRLPGYIVPADV